MSLDRLVLYRSIVLFKSTIYKNKNVTYEHGYDINNITTRNYFSFPPLILQLNMLASDPKSTVCAMPGGLTPRIHQCYWSSRANKGLANFICLRIEAPITFNIELFQVFICAWYTEEKKPVGHMKRSRVVLIWQAVVFSLAV